MPSFGRDDVFCSGVIIYFLLEAVFSLLLLLSRPTIYTECAERHKLRPTTVRYRSIGAICVEYIERGISVEIAQATATTTTNMYNKWCDTITEILWLRVE